MTVRYMLSGDPKDLEILLYGDIGIGGASAEAIGRLLSANPNANVLVRINSLGGDAFDGIAISNRLAQHAGNTTAQIDGIAASAASLAAMGCKRIVMAKNATMMIHGVQMQQRGSVEEIDRKLAPMRALNVQLAETYAKRSGKSQDEVMAMMVAETHLTAEEAVAAGFADEIVEPLSIAAKMTDMLTLEAPAEDPEKPAEAPAPEKPAEKPEASGDLAAFGDALAKATGYAPSAILAALLEEQDAIVEMLTRKLGDGAPMARRSEVELLAAQVAALKVDADKLKAEAAERVKAEIDARVDGLIRDGFCPPTMRDYAVYEFTKDAKAAALKFTVKLVPVGADSEQAGTVPPVTEEKPTEAQLVTDTERLTLVQLRGGGMTTEKAVEKIIARRARGAA